jgi:hypothetical protein
MSQTTQNSTAFIEAQQYSQFILMNLKDGLLPGTFFRDVSDFPAGSTLNIKVVGDATIQEVEEDVAVTYSPIDSSTVTLTITDYTGDGWYITDMLRQDGAQVEALHQARAMASTRALQEVFETRFLRTAGILAQTAANPNQINGFDHRWVADSAANDSYMIGLQDFIDMKLSFDKANVPQAGRIALVDPVVEARLNGLAGNFNVDRNPQFQQLLEEGFAKEHKFLFNLMGWDIWTSNRLPRIGATEAITHKGVTDTAPVGAIANIFMSVLDDQTRPIMGAWRQKPSVESGRNKDLARDEFVSRSRFGFGRQRSESLGVVLTSPSNY